MIKRVTLLFVLLYSGLSCLQQASQAAGWLPLVANVGTATITYKDSNGSSATTATIDYGTRTYGSGCNALVIPVLWYNNTTADTITGITVGGSAASQISGVYGANTNGEITNDLWQFNSPTGTSADIQVTYSHAPTFSSGIAVYCLVTATTTVSAATHTNGGTPSSNLSLAVPSNGAGVAFAGSNAGQAITYTNATHDASVVTGGAAFDFAHTTATGTVSITATTASDVVGLGAASWGP